MATQMMMDAFENKYDRPLSLLEAREIMHAYASQGDKSYPRYLLRNNDQSSGIEVLVREA